MTDFDEQARERIRAGDASVADDLLARDHAIAELLVRAVAASGTDTSETAALAWERLVNVVRAGAVTGNLRAALLKQVVAVLDGRGHLDRTAISPRPFFAPPGDRWAGWWVDNQTAWPPVTELTSAKVVTALRRVPVDLRILLILRDAANLSADDAEPTVHRPGREQAPLLDTARLTYLAGFDSPAKESAPAQEPAGPDLAAAQPGAHEIRLGERSARQGVDLNCQVVFGLVGRWHDGDMPGRERDAYEQHLLFCPPCLVQLTKVRTGIAALRQSATVLAGDGLRGQLHQLIRTGL